MTAPVENGMCKRDLNIWQVRQRHRRGTLTGKLYGTKKMKRKKDKEQTQHDQIRHEVGEETWRKKYPNPVESRVDT